MGSLLLNSNEGRREESEIELKGSSVTGTAQGSSGNLHVKNSMHKLHLLRANPDAHVQIHTQTAIYPFKTHNASTFFEKLAI